MGTLVSITLAFAIGAALSLQPPINTVMARTVGNPLLASSISIAISLAFVITVWLAFSRGAGDLSRLTLLPWWVTLGGVIGVFFVLGGVTISREMGIALFFVCVVAGQLVGSTLVDQFGAFGSPQKPITMLKLAGIALVLLGAALVRTSGSE